MDARLRSRQYGVQARAVGSVTARNFWDLAITLASAQMVASNAEEEDMSKARTTVFDAKSVPETNATSYPEPFRAANQNRFNRRLGNHAGLGNYGVNMTRIIPGGQSSSRHAHSRQDEFVMVLEGEVVLETDAGSQTLGPGMCAGFPAGSGDAHRFLNTSSRDAVLLVVGDRTAGDEVIYPDVDMHGKLGPDGRYRFTRKDGTPY
jgi:uncharacterized cupin superfamily protein